MLGWRERRGMVGKDGGRGRKDRVEDGREEGMGGGKWEKRWEVKVGGGGDRGEGGEEKG